MPLSDLHKRRRTRNIVMLTVLLGLVVLFFVMSMVRMGGW